MKLKIAQVIGLNTDQKAAQVSSATRNGDNAFLAVLELSCDDAFTKGRQILSELEDFYFESEGKAAEKLEVTFKQAQEKLAQEVDWNLCLAAISGKVLYIIGKGQVEVYLKRAGKLSPLLSSTTPTQLISGFLEAQDRLLFSTLSLITFLGQELEKSLNLPIETFEEEVGSRIGTSDLEDKGLAALTVELLGEDLDISPLQEEQAQEAEQPTTGDFSPKVLAVLGIAVNSAARLLGKLLGYFPKSGRGRLVVAVILIVIIAGGVGYKFKADRDKRIQAQFNGLLQQAKDNFNAAKGLASLNPADAKTKLELAKSDLDKALALKLKSADADNFKKQIEAESPAILQEMSVSDFPLFLDLDLVKKNFRASQMSLSSGKLLLLDTEVKSLVLVDLAKKSNKILAGSEQLGEASFVSLNGGLAFIYSKDKGILKIDTTNQKVVTVSKKDDEWGAIYDLYGFGSNVYVLDSGKNQIWKYLPAGDTYSAKREYLSKGVKADFGGALRMQIESSVYVLKKGGEILRFTKGDKDNFSLSGLPSGIKDPKSIFASSDAENFYVLDSGNSRLLILTKTGSYKGQITGSKFATSTDLVVDEEGKKVYLLDGSKIYSVDLK